MRPPRPREQSCLPTTARWVFVFVVSARARPSWAGVAARTVVYSEVVRRQTRECACPSHCVCVKATIFGVCFTPIHSLALSWQCSRQRCSPRKLPIFAAGRQPSCHFRLGKRGLSSKEARSRDCAHVQALTSNETRSEISGSAPREVKLGHAMETQMASRQTIRKHTASACIIVVSPVVVAFFLLLFCFQGSLCTPSL